MITNEQFWTYWRNKQYEEALACMREQPVKKTASMLFGPATDLKQTMAISTISAGEFLYDYIMINPLVVKGMDFARTEDLSSLFQLQQFAENIDISSVTGDIAQLQGYVAEQMMAAELQGLGHEVQFPETSNQAGWDLLIDGEPFQVKCLTSAQGVHKHFDTYPDIPVYVNAELAATFANNPLVYSTSVTHEQVLLQTTQTLEHAEDLLDFELPWITVAVSSYYNVKRVRTDGISLTSAMRNVTSDVVSRVALGGVGKVIFGVGGVALFGPAGGIVGPALGAFAGVSQGTHLSTFIKKTLAKKEYADVVTAIQQLIRKMQTQLQRKQHIKETKWQQMGQHLAQSTASKRFINGLSPYARQEQQYNNNLHDELAALYKNTEKQPLEVFEHVIVILAKSGIHQHSIREELVAVEKAMKEYKRTI